MRWTGGISVAIPWQISRTPLTNIASSSAGPWLMPALFVAGDLLPEHLDLPGTASQGTDPRNFVGSSGATYFLAATLAAALLLHSRDRWPLALSVPAFGLTVWFAQANAHGLVAAEGFALGGLVWVLRRHAPRPAHGSP